ncbi:hypothetical protein MANES_10G054600v8 [Manihot esculenta]|uniref:Uncharacterized protein n=1 Tax=Manihot esculenta TaxID=3983 RepID=A0A2C9V3F0_MANES|nr:hypothetical protein MANES_10G054600v8 [Manihot esculenta]
MAKAEIVTQQDSSEEPKNLFSFLKRFGLKLPVFNEDKKAPSKSVVKDEAEMAVGGDGEADNTKQRPNFVRFPNAHPIIPPPLDIELEESSGKTHNPVYALGGFIILKWVWARWKERKERAKKASPDNDQPSDEYLSPPDDND